MAPKAQEAPPEADRLDGVPHPRETYVLFGHAAAEAALLDAYRAGRLPHAILIGGPSGIGKATLAWRLARFLFAHPDPAAPEVQAASDLFVAPETPAAHRVASLSHPDLFLLRREWNEKAKRAFTEIRADDVRRAIHVFQRAAGAGGYRVCILDCAEDLNRSGANALLKLIEEPPPRSVFLIVAHRPGQVLATIRSRCHKLLLKPLPPLAIAEAVTALGAPWSQTMPEDLEGAASRAQGSVRDAVRLLAGGGLALDARMNRLFTDLPAVDWRAVHALADDVADRDNATAYETMLTGVFDWLDRSVRGGAGAPEAARRLAPLAEVWEKIAAAARECDALNLDRRQLVLSIFADLAAAARVPAS